MWIAALPPAASRLRRIVLPSMATSRPAEARSAIHVMKYSSKAAGSSAAKTRPDMSCDGMPLDRSRKVLNHFFLHWPNSATYARPSAPQMTAQMAVARLSKRPYFFVQFTRGSFSWSNACSTPRGALAPMPQLLPMVKDYPCVGVF